MLGAVSRPQFFDREVWPVVQQLPNQRQILVWNPVSLPSAMRLGFDRRRLPVPPDQPVHRCDAYLERPGELLPRPFPLLPCGYDPLPEIDRQWCWHERIRSKPIDRRKGVPLSLVFGLLKYLNDDARYAGTSAAPSHIASVLASKSFTDEVRAVLTRRSKAATKTAGGTPNPDGPDVELSEEERRQIVEKVSAQITSNLGDEAAAAIRERCRKAWESAEAKVVVAENRLVQTRDRLFREMWGLAKRGNLNLALGFVTALGGMVLLTFFTLRPPSPPQPSSSIALLMQWAPRLSLVILVEVFAYFFLRLYRASLADIKFFQNEVTTAEMRCFAVAVAIFTDDRRALRAAIAGLNQIDRNGPLQNGQTNHSLEQMRLDYSEFSGAVRALSGLASKARKESLGSGQMPRNGKSNEKPPE